MGGYFVISSSGQAKSAPPSQTPSTSQSSGTFTGNAANPVTIVSDNLTVGFQAGIWAVEVQNSGTKPISALTLILNTPQETKLCTGTGGGLEFLNCPAGPGPNGPIPPGGTVTGYASGAGAGSATVGKLYILSIAVVFTDGSSANINATVTATAAA